MKNIFLILFGLIVVSSQTMAASNACTAALQKANGFLDQTSIREKVTGIFAKEDHSYFPSDSEKFFLEIALCQNFTDASNRTEYHPIDIVTRLLIEIAPESFSPGQRREIIRNSGLSSKARFFVEVFRGKNLELAALDNEYFPNPRETYLLRAFRGEPTFRYSDQLRHGAYPEDRAYAKLATMGLGMATLLFAYLPEDYHAL